MKYGNTGNKKQKVWNEWVKDEKNKQLKQKYNKFDKEMQEIATTKKYHYDTGYLVSGSMFTLSMFFVYIISGTNTFFYITYISRLILFFDNLFLPEFNPLLLFTTEILIMVSIGNFVYIWIRTMNDMRGLFQEKMDIAIEFKEEQFNKNNAKII